MRTLLTLAAGLLAAPSAAETPVPSPGELVAKASASDWTAIAPADLLVMDLSPDAKGADRRVVIQLMPAPFAQDWIGNIRKLAAAKWWDGLAVNRVQDNYVAQWGDPDGEDKAKAKSLPPGLTKPSADGYYHLRVKSYRAPRQPRAKIDPYAEAYGYDGGFPSASDATGTWPVHCYGMVGVGRDMPPDTGSGAELYTVIGHAPRHLDRNIALVGRVIEGIEHLSSLPRGTGPLGFYATAEERTAIRSIRIGSDVSGLAAYQYLSPASASFKAYAEARANRRDAFFVTPAGGADICNLPVPVRRVP
ncbi:peptidylprolyl isomerase [Novosphingobium kunmingense]|uniref:Peptidylprolyl isomerase n=1 Tax=Novosphingobium kunmingense TaxID=1211806 RepID=A0A2N0HJF0_9SPHN|nr:peptidylprolyl isomerase [Novosphingobium kunmingense]PKB19070.1 peptidylprolyl isomerase [Novosphingobium kunmingense]